MLTTYYLHFSLLSKMTLGILKDPQIWTLSSRKTVLRVQDMTTFSKYLSDGTGDKYSCAETG